MSTTDPKALRRTFKVIQAKLAAGSVRLLWIAAVSAVGLGLTMAIAGWP